MLYNILYCILYSILYSICSEKALLTKIYLYHLRAIIEIKQFFFQEKGHNGSATIPVSFPSNDSCTLPNSVTNGGQPQQISSFEAATLNLERPEEQPRFCVCLQQMPEPIQSQDWFDMQPTRELNGGQVTQWNQSIFD